MFNTPKNLDNRYKLVLKVLLIIIVMAVVFHMFWQLVLLISNTDNRVVNDIVNRFGLDEELSFPTWVNSSMALIAGILAFIVGKNHKSVKSKTVWFVIAIDSVLISLDEVAALHELLLQGLHILADFGEGQGLLANAWMIVAPIILIGVILFVRLMHKQLPGDTFKNMAFALAVYMAGAFVVEYLSIPFDKSLIIYNFGAVVLEESLELVGVWLATRAILVHINRHEKSLNTNLLDLL